MVRITIDDELKKKLLASGEVVELVDASGKLLARVLPELEEFPNGWEAITPEITDEELKRRLAYDGPGISTEELLRRLREKR